MRQRRISCARDEFHAPDKKNFLMKTIIFVEIHLRPPAKATRSLRSGPYAQSHRDESNAASPTQQVQRSKSNAASPTQQAQRDKPDAASPRNALRCFSFLSTV